MKKLILFILLLAILAAAYFFNPNEDMHKEAVAKRLNEYVHNEMESQINKADEMGEIAKFLLHQLSGNEKLKDNLDKIIDKSIQSIVDYKVGYENYYLFSISTINYKGENRRIGFGAFKNVYVPQIPKDLQLFDELNPMESSDLETNLDELFQIGDDILSIFDGLFN